MTRIPFDQLAKQYLEDFLEPLGTVQRSLEVPGESKLVDLWFTPNPGQQGGIGLGLLNRIATTPCLLEPFRNAPTYAEIKSCLLKLLWLQEDHRRKTKGQKPAPTPQELPKLWVLAATASQPVITKFGGAIQPDWGKGIYHFPPAYRTAIVAIDKLPPTLDTLWLRILGRDEVQQQAIAELLALPGSDPYRDRVLQLLINWRVTINLPELNPNKQEQEDRNIMVALSQAYYEWETLKIQEGIRQGKLEGKLDTVLRLLDRRVGSLSDDSRTQIQALSLHQIENLADELLDFTSAADLTNWLQRLADRLTVATHHLQQCWENLAPDLQAPDLQISDLQIPVQQLSTPQLATLVELLPQVARRSDLVAWIQGQLSNGHLDIIAP